MAQGDGAAVEVYFLLGDAELAHAGERLRGERLVELDHIDILNLEARAGECLLGRGDRADAHDLWRAASDADRLEARQGLELVALGVVLGADQHGRGAVGERG